MMMMIFIIVSVHHSKNIQNIDVIDLAKMAMPLGEEGAGG